MKPDVKRPYRSPVREAQARATRAAVLDAAWERFRRDGYTPTTLADIAADAGVSVDTIYKSFGSKRNLLGEVLGRAVAGDDRPMAVPDRPETRRVRDDPDPRSQVSAFAADVAARVARMRPVDDVMLGAAHADPEVARMRADIQLRQRRAGLTSFTESVADHGGLRPEVDRESAAATAWALASPEVHRLLVDGWGWSQERYAAWLADALARTLLD